MCKRRCPLRPDRAGGIRGNAASRMNDRSCADANAGGWLRDKHRIRSSARVLGDELLDHTRVLMRSRHHVPGEGCNSVRNRNYQQTFPRGVGAGRYPGSSYGLQVEMNRYHAEVAQSCVCVVPILGTGSAYGGSLEVAHARASC